MPRNFSSKSRSRSGKRTKRVHHDSSESDRQSRRKHKHEPVRHDLPQKINYDLKEKSDIKFHVRYNDIRIRRREDKDVIMQQVQIILQKQFGKIALVKEFESSQSSFSFGVGFKYDVDALQFSKQCGFITSKVDRLKLKAIMTPVFRECLPMIKEARRQEKQKAQSRSPRQRHKRSYSSQKNQKKRKEHSPYSRDEHRRSRDKSEHRRYDDQSIWVFGLPWSIKGKEVAEYLLHRHPSGPFQINSWRWLRLKNSNCEFMELNMDAKKAQKLLSLRQQFSIEGYPCIITNAVNWQSEEAVKSVLKQYQIRLQFPQKVYPEYVGKVFSDFSGVVQLVSCQRLSEGRSDSYVITLASASKVRELKKLNLRQGKISIEDSKGQLVYRPTKHSRLSVSQ